MKKNFSVRLHFSSQRAGIKTYLDPHNEGDAKIISTLYKMDKRGTLSTAYNLCYRDFGDGALTPEQQTRLKSDTSVQGITYAIMESQKRTAAALGDYASSVIIIGSDPFDRTKSTRYEVDGRQPLMVVPNEGNQFEGEMIARELRGREKRNPKRPLFIFNPDGFWDDLLTHPELAAGAASSSVIICRSDEELYNNVKSYLDANPVVPLLAKKRTGNGFVIQPAAPVWEKARPSPEL